MEVISTGDRRPTAGQAQLIGTRGIGHDGVAAGYLFGSAAFLAIGALLWLAAMASVRFPNLLPLSYGHLRPMALTALWLGWMVLGLSAGIYHLLPRLTGSPLVAGPIASMALPASVVVVLLGIVAIAFGFGDGREPFALPAWLDVPVVILAAVPALATMGTLRARNERSVYPTVWFVIAAVTWLPVLYLAANLPG
ncbi:MAG: hypothetical protein WD354_04780, partial [Acidimicrobiia bacterium]